MVDGHIARLVVQRVRQAQDLRQIGVLLEQVALAFGRLGGVVEHGAPEVGVAEIAALLQDRQLEVCEVDANV